MKYRVIDKDKNLQNIQLYKVAEDHYVLYIWTKKRYYESYANHSGLTLFNNKPVQSIGVMFYDDDECFEVTLIGEQWKDYVVLAVEPLKNQYHITLMPFDKAFMHNYNEIIQLEEVE